MNIKRVVEKIINDVRLKGDKAVCFYTEKFDKVKIAPSQFEVTTAEIQRCVEELQKKDREVYSAIKKSAENIKEFHIRQLKTLRRSWSYKKNGSIFGERLTPVDSVAIYVPGGRYPYPSSALMTAIPARIAGVKKIVMITPPGGVVPPVLLAASVAGIDKVYRIGGVQAVAAVSFGTETIPKVDMVVGPGNAYVTEAKRQLFGVVGIDMLAGPSEVVVIADSSTPVSFIVNDLLAQVEHDPLSRAFLFTDSQKQIDEVKKLIPSIFKNNISINKTSISKTIHLVNEIAPEHLELLIKKPRKVLNKIKNAGAIFIGSYTPTALGDYFAGPSHVLPTGGSARFSSGISVSTFMKRSSIISSNKNALRNWSDYVIKMADVEGLSYHAESVRIRSKSPSFRNMRK